MSHAQLDVNRSHSHKCALAHTHSHTHTHTFALSIKLTHVHTSTSTAPHTGCTKCTGTDKLPTESISSFGIAVNPEQDFDGPVISCMYKTGLFPVLKCPTNATPCWTGKHPCSWDPWGDIAPAINGGVPQAANITAHVQQLAVDVAAQIPDESFSGFAILDWEAWRPLTTENDDGGFGCVSLVLCILTQYHTSVPYCSRACK